MRKTRIRKHSFSPEEFLQKLGLDGECVLAIESVSLVSYFFDTKETKTIQIDLHIIEEEEE